MRENADRDCDKPVNTIKIPIRQDGDFCILDRITQRNLLRWQWARALR